MKCITIFLTCIAIILPLNAFKFKTFKSKSFQIFTKSTLPAIILATFMSTCNPLLVLADSTDQGANDTSNTKILRGGASTLQKGIAKVITRGVNLDRSDFSDLNLAGVAFQQSIVRDCDFRRSNLRGASFFE